MEVPLKLALFILFLLIVGGSYFFSVWTNFVYRTLERKLRDAGKKFESMEAEEVGKLWHTGSWEGNDPYEVVSAAYVMAESPRFVDHQKTLHLTTSYYSQVPKLLKKMRIATAIAFYLMSRRFSFQALIERFTTKAERDPMDLEVIGAPDFMLAARLPRFLVSGPWTKAVTYLLAAEHEFEIHMDPLLNPVGRGLVLAKLFHLTTNEEFKNQVRMVGIDLGDPDIDHNQLGRVARWLGFKGVGELFAFLDSQVPGEKQGSVEELMELAEEAPEQGEMPAKEPGNPRLAPIEGKFRRVDPPKDGPRQVLKRDTLYGSSSANEPGGSPPSKGTPPEPSAAS